MIIGSRGTFNFDDILVDQKLNSGHLSKTDRYITDKKTLLKLMMLKPHHTLYVTGGAIASMWSKEVARIKAAIVYNTAIQPHEIDSDKITRLYTSTDPLLRVFGNRYEKTNIIIPTTSYTRGHSLARFEPYYKCVKSYVDNCVPEMCQYCKINKFEISNRV